MSEKQPLRQSYTFYLSFEEGLQHLDDHDELIMRRALSRYALYGEMPDLPGYLMLGFTSWKANVDSSNERREASAANGKRGGAPKGNQNARKHPKEENNPEQPKTTQNNPEQSNINITMNLKETIDDKENVNTGSAGPDSRSRPYKEVDVDKEKLSLYRFMPPEGLRDATPEEIEENNQKKVLALQKLRQEVNK